MSAIVFGGYGVFGSIVAADLADAGASVAIAGRDRAKAERRANELGGTAVAVDVNDRDACARAIHGHTVAVNCSGPFRAANTALLEACLDLGVHYADIADDRAYCTRVRELGPRFAARGLTAAWGLSSLPGISGALAVAMHRGPAPRQVRVTLVIGNHNPKGAAAIRSAVAMLGREIQAPQGPLRGFRDPEAVDIPPPFGRRIVANADSPDYDVLPALVGTGHVRVKVGFELASSNLLFRTLALAGPVWGDRTAWALGAAGSLASWIGVSGGAVVTELFYENGATRRGSVSGREHAQRMAARPCSLVVEALLWGAKLPTGAVMAHEAIGSADLLEGLAASGFAVCHDPA